MKNDISIKYNTFGEFRHFVFPGSVVAVVLTSINDIYDIYNSIYDVPDSFNSLKIINVHELNCVITKGRTDFTNGIVICLNDIKTKKEEK